MPTTFPIEVTTARLVEFHGLADALCQAEIGRLPTHTSWDPVGEIILLQALQGQTGAQIQQWLHDQPEAIAYRSIPPITVDIRHWRGAFCIPDALPGQPAGFGDGKRIWTPAYGAYPDEWRAKILGAYLARGYTHFVYNPAAPNGVYHNDYPALPDDPARARRDLLEIRRAGLVPVCPAFDDTILDAPLRSFVENADLIPICFPLWEMNGPFEGDTAKINACILATRAAAPHADCYIHFTAGHGAGGEPEGAWWQWAAKQGVVGLLSQDDGYNRKPDGDPVGTAAGLSDTARHFRGLVPGWEGLHLLNVAFEQITTPLYHSGWTEVRQLAYGADLLRLASGIAGFCDGGPV